MRQYGIVRKMKPNFGFIMDVNGVDRFFHWSSMSAESVKGFHMLREKDRVSFVPHEETQSDGTVKPQAQEVIAVVEVRQPKQEKPS